MGARKLDFEIKTSIFDDLLAYQQKLPSKATGATDNSPSYENPAGMVLLGQLDGELDTIVPLKMSGGCWDAPNISYTDMDKGFRALIDTGRICAGMALVRHPAWNKSEDSMQGVMPSHLRQQLHGMRNGFADITKTAWIVLHNNYFRVYRPSKGSDGKITCAEVDVRKLFAKEEIKGTIVETKLLRDVSLRKAKALELLNKRKALALAKREKIRLAKEEEDRRIAVRNAELTKIEAAHQAAVEKAKRAKKKTDEMNKKIKSGEDAIIDAGGGMVFMRQPNGEYILWQTGT